MPENTEEPLSSCSHLNELIRVETGVMRKHIDNHKWFQHIQDENIAFVDFIERYGWIMREMYCGFICEQRGECTLAEQFLPEDDKAEGG